MALTGRKCVISPADTVNTSAPVSMRSLPSSSTSVGDALDLAVPGQAGPHPVADRHAARPVVGGQRRVGARSRSASCRCGSPGAEAPRRPASVRSVAVHRASTARWRPGSGASSAVIVTFRPRPTTTTGSGAATSARMPASFPLPTRTSLGHFRPARHAGDLGDARPPPRPRSAAAASPTSRWARRRRRHRPTARSATAAGVDQLRPCLPRPAVWYSASSTAPSMSSPAAARASRSALVEPVSSTTSTRRQRGRARPRPRAVDRGRGDRGVGPWRRAPDQPMARPPDSIDHHDEHRQGHRTRGDPGASDIDGHEERRPADHDP